jgi:archaellum component FlaC
MKVERSIDEIMTNIDKLSNHLNAYKEVHDSLGKTIGTAVNHFNKSSKEFNKIDKDITKISGGKSSIEFEQNTIERPQLDE